MIIFTAFILSYFIMPLPEHIVKIVKNCGWQQCPICKTWCAIVTDGACGVRCQQIKTSQTNRTSHKGEQKNLIEAGLLTN